MSGTIPPPRRAERGAVVLPRPTTPPQARVAQAQPADCASAQCRSYAACFAHFVVEARSIAESDVLAYPGEARLALSNVRAGVDAVCADPAAIARHLPLLPLAQAMEACDVARALVHVEASMSYRSAPSQPRKDVVRRVTTARRQMLNVARSLAGKGLMPADDVALLGHLPGEPAMVNDAVRVVELFTACAPDVTGKHPFTQKDFDDLRSDAEWLRENTRPRGARPRKVTVGHTPASDRDRLWTMLVQRHAILRRIAGYFHEGAVEKVVPPLRSRVRAAPDAVEEDPAPTPAPAPAPIG